MHHLRGFVFPAFNASFDRTHPTHLFLQFLLGMPVHLVQRTGGLTQVMEVTQLMRHTRQRLPDGIADRMLAVRHHCDDGHLEGISHFNQQL